MKRFKSDFLNFYKYAIYQAKADLKSEVANSYLNWLWWILDPLFFMLIYTFVSVVVFNSSEPYFVAFVFLGLTVWEFFQRVLIQSTELIRAKKMIVLRVYVPKYMLLFSKLLVNAFKMMVSFMLVLIMVLIYNIKPNMCMLTVIPIFISLAMITFGIATLLLHFGVLIEDLKHVTEIGLKLVFYFSGIFYSIIERIPQPYSCFLLYMNPIAFHIDALRKALLFGKCCNITCLLIWFLIGVVLSSIGIYMIYKYENDYAKII